MTRAAMLATAKGQGASFELDEAFFHLVDRADLASRLNDPYRLEQANRALQEEVRLAHLSGAMRSDRDRPRRGDVV
ncbi:hypothetical protein ACSFBX_10330 [Variovorax sp. RB2P76]|uniref:hypothetical protein n=1 Tax=Variovorax sp. RB2P76 TaxID=3443736 RepID=UPI003F4879FA